MITNEERLNLEARIKELEESCRVKDQKFDQLCKDFDARDAELKRIIANERAKSGVSITWIDVVDSLPDADRTVLISTVDDDEPVWIGWLDGDSWRDTLGGKVKVSHWAEFPEPSGSA